MQLLEVSGAVRPIYGSLGVKRLMLGRFIDAVCLLASHWFPFFGPKDSPTWLSEGNLKRFLNVLLKNLGPILEKLSEISDSFFFKFQIKISSLFYKICLCETTNNSKTCNNTVIYCLFMYLDMLTVWRLTTHIWVVPQR